jgi:gliding motility-associated-like protein
VVASSPYGCLARDTIAIIVHPSIQFSLSATSEEICKGDSVSLTASGADLYYWLPSTVSGNSVKWFKPDSTILISAKLYRADCNYADTLSKNIIVYNRPLANIFLQDTLLCEGQSVLLNSVTENNVNYQWTPVMGLNNANISNPSVTPIVSNKYYLKAFSVPYCYTTDSVMIAVKATPDFTLSPLTDTICIGTSILLKTSGSEKSKWLNKQFAQSITPYTLLVKPDSTQVYPIQLFDSTCNLIDTLYSTIVVAPKPVIELTKSNDFYCNVDTVFLRASGGAYYEWQPANKVSNPGISNPFISQNNGKQIFEVTVYSSRGCSSSKSILINDFTYPARQFLVPNAFTPNNDGLNDCFGVAKWGGAVRNFRMNIYNRGGQLVFTSDEINKCWDGTVNGNLQASGTYVYQIEAATDCEIINRNGIIILIR